ncbi:uncharacterized protein LOC142408754 [Mycteria americana]|uniref:uncharacterized protein LOC142408754 n=1 Tax=Mycteria americana TaxID=33587 RepID=UPI003F58CB0B
MLQKHGQQKSVVLPAKQWEDQTAFQPAAQHWSLPSENDEPISAAERCCTSPGACRGSHGGQGDTTARTLSYPCQRCLSLLRDLGCLEARKRLLFPKAHLSVHLVFKETNSSRLHENFVSALLHIRCQRDKKPCNHLGRKTLSHFRDKITFRGAEYSMKQKSNVSLRRPGKITKVRKGGLQMIQPLPKQSCRSTFPPTREQIYDSSRAGKCSVSSILKGTVLSRRLLRIDSGCSWTH